MRAPVVRKRDQVADMLRGRIAAGELRPGDRVPSGPELSRETGIGVLTCRAALRILLAEGVLTRVSQTARHRVAGGGGEPELLLACSLASRRRRAGLTQRELAGMLGLSVTSVGHAETGRLWQSRRFWEKADVALGAGGALLDRYDACREARAEDAFAGLTPGRDAGQASAAAEAGEEPPTAAAAAQEAPAGSARPGIVITLPCDPMPVTVRWGDGSVTTVQPGTDSGD